jgi:phosphatidate cytidylyltransferase
MDDHQSGASRAEGGAAVNGLFVDPVVGWFVLGVYGLLMVASAVVWLLVRLRPGVSFTELALRVKSWWIMVTILALAFLFSRTASIVFFAFLSFLALKEYFSIIPIRRSDRRVLFWAYLAIPFQYYWVATGWYGMFIIFIPVYMFMFLPMRMIAIGQTSGFLNAIGSIHWGLMILVFSISHLAFLLVLPDSTGSDISGPGLVLYLVFLTQFNDVAQYIWGKSLGRHKVVPLVSPNKTWEGLLGGIATTAVLAVACAGSVTVAPHAVARAAQAAAAASILPSARSRAIASRIQSWNANVPGARSACPRRLTRRMSAHLPAKV